jgi:hypothetical protein
MRAQRASIQFERSEPTCELWERASSSSPESRRAARTCEPKAASIKFEQSEPTCEPKAASIKPAARPNRRKSPSQGRLRRIHPSPQKPIPLANVGGVRRTVRVDLDHHELVIASPRTLSESVFKRRRSIDKTLLRKQRCDFFHRPTTVRLRVLCSSWASS